MAPNQLELVLADNLQVLESSVEGGLECRVDGGRPAPQLEWQGLDQLQLVSQDIQVHVLTNLEHMKKYFFLYLLNNVFDAANKPNTKRKISSKF